MHDRVDLFLRPSDPLLDEHRESGDE